MPCLAPVGIQQTSYDDVGTTCTGSGNNIRWASQHHANATLAQINGEFESMSKGSHSYEKETQRRAHHGRSPPRRMWITWRFS